MNNGCKRFHKFWFLVLENPGDGRGFLVVEIDLFGANLVQKKNPQPVFQQVADFFL